MSLKRNHTLLRRAGREKWGRNPFDASPLFNFPSVILSACSEWSDIICDIILPLQEEVLSFFLSALILHSVLEIQGSIKFLAHAETAVSQNIRVYFSKYSILMKVLIKNSIIIPDTYLEVSLDTPFCLQIWPLTVRASLSWEVLRVNYSDVVSFKGWLLTKLLMKTLPLM